MSTSNKGQVEDTEEIA